MSPKEIAKTLGKGGYAVNEVKGSLVTVFKYSSGKAGDIVKEVGNFFKNLF